MDTELNIESVKEAVNLAFKEKSQEFDNKSAELKELLVKSEEALSETIANKALQTEESIKEFTSKYIEKELGDLKAVDKNDANEELIRSFVISQEKLAKDGEASINMKSAYAYIKAHKNQTSGDLSTTPTPGILMELMPTLRKIYEQDNLTSRLPNYFTDKPKATLPIEGSVPEFTEQGDALKAQGAENYTTSKKSTIDYTIQQWKCLREFSETDIDDDPEVELIGYDQINEAFWQHNIKLAFDGITGSDAVNTVSTGSATALPTAANVISKLDELIYSISNPLLRGSTIYLSREFKSLIENEVGKNYWGFNVLTNANTYKSYDLVVLDQFKNSAVANHVDAFIGNLEIASAFFRRQDLVVRRDMGIRREFTLSLVANYRASVFLLRPTAISKMIRKV